jgi:hypothetical protein
MKRAILLLSILSFGYPGFSQVIKGTIFDQKTKEPIYSASVYFNGTFGGTLSDQKGTFELNISKYSGMQLTISALGYYSATITSFEPGKPLYVYLNPKLFELEEVVVKSKSHTRERRENLTVFRSEFLGTTSNALNCNILNEEDIRFIYNRDNDTIKAYALKPILIENKALGYKITYYLDKFEYYKQSSVFVFKGNAIFSEDTVAGENKKLFFERKRTEAFKGSRLQFFRALWNDDLNQAGFTVKNSANETLGSKKIVVQSDNRTKYLKYPGGLAIAFYSKTPTSFIIFLKDKVYFDANGYYDPSGISWEGDMAKKRIADLLPFDYIPK